MIQPIGVLAPKTYFKGQSGNYENPEAQKTKKNIALVNAAGFSTVTGAVMMAVARSAVPSWKSAAMIGGTTSALTMMFLAPMFLYKANVKSFVKEKDAQKKIIADVNQTIDSKSNSVIGKLKSPLRKAA